MKNETLIFSIFAIILGASLAYKPNDQDYQKLYLEKIKSGEFTKSFNDFKTEMDQEIYRFY